MDSLILTLLILLAFGLIIGIPIGLSYLIFRFIKNRNYNKHLRTLALIPVLILAYFIYDAFYPSDSFYEQDFEEVTGLSFPEDGTIEYRTASFPDHFGDYTSVALVNVERGFFSELPEQLVKRGFEENTQKMNSREFNSIVKRFGELKIEREFTFEQGGGVYYYVGFLSDQQSIIVQRSSS